MPGLHGIGIVLWIYILNITVRGQIPLPNAVVAINGQTMLDCTTSILAGSNWKRTSDGTSDLVTIANDCDPVTGDNAAFYRTEKRGGTICRLIIANVTMQQAGVYSCYDGISTGFRSLVTVVDPVANVVVYNQSEVVEGYKLNISCSINYTAQTSPAPSLRPSPYFTTSPEQIFTSTTYPTTNVVTLMATVTVQKPTVSVFQCRTVFEITGNTSVYNPAPPPNNFTVGSTAELDVQYAPSVPVVTSRHEVIAINDVPCDISVLTCNSTGNPTPKYKWFDSSENAILSTSSTLTLSEVNRNYKCEAYNTIRNMVHKASTTHTVADGKCGSTSTVGLQCCVFPRNETTSLTVKGCNNGTLCDCSQSNSSIILHCNAKTFPNASYTWSGPNGKVTKLTSPIFDQVTMNGVYRCTAYFSRASSNYTGDVTFPNGTNETTVGKCYMSSSDLIRTIILACVLGGYGLLNLIATIAFIVYYNRKSNTVNKERQAFTFRNKMTLNARFPWLQRMLPCMNESEGNSGCTFLWVLVFILMSIFAGIIVFPILVAMANCSRENNDSRDDPDIGMSNVYHEDTIDRNAATKSGTDAHGHVEAPYDEIGTMHPGRKGAIEEPTSSKNKDARKVFYTKVNPHSNPEEGVERYSVST